MFHLVESNLDTLTHELLNLYGVLMSINDLLYWIMPDQMIMSAAVKEKEYKVLKRLMTLLTHQQLRRKVYSFPVLIHELIKGVYEVLGTQGLPDDPKAAEMVMGQTDTLPYEVWDLRLGPVIWERFTSCIS